MSEDSFKDMHYGLGPRVITFDRLAFQRTPTSFGSISRHRCVGSYSILHHDGVPRIACPGVPAQFVQNGVFGSLLDIEDPNYDTSRFSSAPLAPMFVALNHCSPGFDFSSTDIVADSKVLDQLRLWVESPGGIAVEGRIDAELSEMGAIVLLDWKAANEWATGARSAVQKVWSKQSPESLGGMALGKHYRILQLAFAGLTFLLRRRVDAAINSERSDGTHQLGSLPTNFRVTCRGTYGQVARQRIDVLPFPSTGELLGPGQIVEVKAHKQTGVIGHPGRTFGYIGLHNSILAAMLSQAGYLFLLDRNKGKGSTPPVLVPREKYLNFPEAHRARKELARVGRFLQELRAALSGDSKPFPPGARLSLVFKADELSVHVRDVDPAPPVEVIVHYI